MILWNMRPIVRCVIAILFFALSAGTVLSQTSSLPDASPGIGDLEPLFLEVIINDQPTNLIASFFRHPEGKIGSTAAELKELGIKTDASARPEEVVFLSDIPTVKFEYDEASQLLKINIVDEQRLAREYNQSEEVAERTTTTSGVGLVTNYSLFASSSSRDDGPFAVNDISANLNGWIYSPLGKIYGSGIISTDKFNEYDFLRLDTTWSLSDTKTATTLNIGDSISAGLAWTRPIRFGGLQMQKNFGLRPDLIATPLLKASGSAAVPSTVDVYIGNFKAHSQNVEAGPFSINQIPTVSGVGNARIVVTDPTGREVETTKPFYISSNLLRKGLLDYSVEAGFARLNYGSISDNYASGLMASGTFRYGITDKFTLEGHVEGNAELLNGGLGTTFTFADRALLSIAGSASRQDDGHGYQLFGSLNTTLLGLNFHASTRRSFGVYQDLASITANEVIDTGFANPAFSNSGIAKAFDQLSVGIPLPELNGGLNLSFTHLENVVDEASMFASLSYSQKIFGNASLSVSVYSNLENEDDHGAYIGLSFPLGKRVHATTGVDYNNGELDFTASASQSAKSTPGSWGWRVSDTEGNNPKRSIGVSYRGEATYSQIDVSQSETGLNADALVDGAIVIADSGVFFSNRIDDAFAVVDAGVADVPVYLSNQLKGKTGKNGKLLVPGLLSFEENKIRIDTENLPLNASVDSTHQKIIPGDGAGINVKFGVQEETSSAIVIFTRPDGTFLEVGSEGRLEGKNDTFIIGYDGRAFIEGLQSSNQVEIIVGAQECSASFDFAARSDIQVEVGPVICQ